MEWVRSSGYTGFQHIWFLCLAAPLHVLIVWGLEMETLVKEETLDMLPSP